MSSIWWDNYFFNTFEQMIKTMSYITLIFFPLRLVFSIIFLQENLLNLGIFTRIIGVILFKSTSILLKNGSSITKKIIMYSTVEFFNFTLRYSCSYEPDFSILYCIISTVFTTTFQCNIFLNPYVNILISFKHMYIWYFLGKEIIFSGRLITPAATVGFFMYTVHYIENDKRRLLRETYESKIEKEKAFNQIYQLLNSFSSGIIILTKNLVVKYCNNFALNIINLSVNEYAKELENIFITNNEKLVDKLNFDNINKDYISLGVSKINENSYDLIYQCIDWDGEKCFMIKIQDISKIIELEKVRSENRSTNLLLRSVSHELKTPVSSILLIIEEIFNEIPKRLQEKFKHMKICLDLLKFQISDILDFSEIHFNKFTLNKATYNFRECLKECIDLFSFQVAHKKIDLICKIDPYIPEKCFLDKFRLQKVLVNLLSNSLKYTNQGSIKLSASCYQESVKIFVSDTGIGIPKERLDQIFKLFSDDSNSGLSGLGLHITTKILSYFDSCVNIESEYGKGSTFSFELKNIFEDFPMFEFYEEIDIPDEGSHIPVPNSEHYDYSNNFAKVLVVDDNDFNRMCVGSILKSLNIAYIEAINGKDAIEKVEKCEKMRLSIQLIFMDCNMPVMDGWEASEIINRMFSEGTLKFLPAIVGYTAYSSYEDIKKCFDSRMVSYILKPATRESIISVIHQYVL